MWNETNKKQSLSKILHFLGVLICVFYIVNNSINYSFNGNNIKEQKIKIKK